VANEEKIIKPPSGYTSWLDYAIDTMDTRTEFNSRCFNGDDFCQRDEMVAAARKELELLRRNQKLYKLLTWIL
jgi:hypothetical protein